MHCPFCHSEIPEYAVFCSCCGLQIPGSKEPIADKYAAFISYRHTSRDTKVAQEVQKAIETYKLPRNVIDSTLTNEGIFSEKKGVLISRSLGKCFRDEDELAASHSLPDSIQDALASSRTLILICSPETQSSHWVQREVETFVALHGREKIICVLAEGDSKACIPPILKSRMIPDSQGNMQNTSTGPLAADMRPGSEHKRKSELVRIIAAVADLDYDELRKREQSRKRKRLLISTATATIATILIGAFLLQFHQTREMALIEESKNLTTEALGQYARGEYIASINTILEALPSSETDQSRPLIQEAKDALEKIVSPRPDPDNLWKLHFACDLKGDVVDFSYSQDKGWVIILDATGTIYIYDVHTCRLLAEAQLEVFDPDKTSNPEKNWIIELLSPTALIAAAKYDGTMACYDLQTLETYWVLSGPYTLGVATTNNPDKFVALNLFARSLVTSLVETFTGNLIKSSDITPDHQYKHFFGDSFSVSDDLSTAYCGVDNSLLIFNLRTGECQQQKVTDFSILSTKSTNGYVVTTSAEINNEDVNTQQIPFEICALNSQNITEEASWSYKSTYSATLDELGEKTLPLNGIPKILKTFSIGEDLIIARAGKTLLLINADNGKIHFSQDFDSTVIDAYPYIFKDTDTYVITVILSDGTLSYAVPKSDGVIPSDFGTTRIPHIIDKGQLDTCYGVPVAFVRAYDQPNRFMCYLNLPYLDETNSEEVSLNELLKRARELVGKQSE